MAFILANKNKNAREKRCCTGRERSAKTAERVVSYNGNAMRNRKIRVADGAYFYGYFHLFCANCVFEFREKKEICGQKKEARCSRASKKKSNRFYFHTQQSVAEARIFTSRIGIIIFAAANKMALFLFIKK